jgi:hypothetical protein
VKLTFAQLVQKFPFHGISKVHYREESAASASILGHKSLSVKRTQQVLLKPSYQTTRGQSQDTITLITLIPDCWNSKFGIWERCVLKQQGHISKNNEDSDKGPNLTSPLKKAVLQKYLKVYLDVTYHLKVSLNLTLSIPLCV